MKITETMKLAQWLTEAINPETTNRNEAVRLRGLAIRRLRAKGKTANNAAVILSRAWKLAKLPGIDSWHQASDLDRIRAGRRVKAQETDVLDCVVALDEIAHLVFP